MSQYPDYTEADRAAIAAELDAAGIKRTADGSFTLPERDAYTNEPTPAWLAYAGVQLDHIPDDGQRELVRRHREHEAIAAAPACYTAGQVSVALSQGTDLVDSMTDSPLLFELADRTRAALAGTGPFSYAEVSAALNAVADEIAAEENPEEYETSDTIWLDDVLNLAVNVTGYVLAHPDDNPLHLLDNAVVSAYTEVVDPDFDDLDEGAPEPARGTPGHDEAVVQTVLGWIS